VLKISGIKIIGYKKEELERMAGRVRNYFADGNTSKGYRSFHRANIEGLKHVFILTGPMETEKSVIMKEISMDWLRKGYDVELMHSSRNNDLINGMVVPQPEICIISGTPLEIAYYNGAPLENVRYFDLNSILDLKKLLPYKDEIGSLRNEKQEMYQSAYAAFGEALKIHDEWEKIYIVNMNFDKALKITEELEKSFFEDKSLNKKSVIRDRFLGAATPKGSVDFINNLTEEINKRYFIKGRPGSGKSTMLKKLASEAGERGFDVEIYHCGFDPDSLDMIILREMSTAIFDSTAPHEHFPVRHNDEIIDMYKEAIKPETDIKFASELQKINQRYKNKIQEGTAFLAKAKALDDKLEEIYIRAMDFEKTERIRNEINAEISSVC
jgi:hypothetical protein